MNRVILIGRLTRDPEVRYTQMQTAVARFTVAVNRQVSKESGQPAADFIEVTAFGKTAELMERFFTRGKQIALEGRIRNNRYEDKHGNMVYTYQVIAERIEFVGSKNDGRGMEEKQSDDLIPEGFSAMDEEMPF
nr:MAG TPA: Single strand binding protein [Caudoviricetes sp.]